MLTSGVIEPSHSEWASPIVSGRQKDNSLRFCVDYRKVNFVSKADAYPIPRPDEALAKLGNAKYISMIDFGQGILAIGTGGRI